MKELRGLMEVVKDFDGTPLIERSRPINIKGVITRQCSSFASKNPNQMVEAIDVGSKIHNCNGTIRLGDAEHNILIEAFKTPQMIAIAYVPAKKIVESAEEVDTNAKHTKK